MARPGRRLAGRGNECTRSRPRRRSRLGLLSPRKGARAAGRTRGTYRCQHLVSSAYPEVDRGVPAAHSFRRLLDALPRCAPPAARTATCAGRGEPGGAGCRGVTAAIVAYQPRRPRILLGRRVTDTLFASWKRDPMPTSDAARTDSPNQRTSRAQAPAADGRASARDRLRAAAAALGERGPSGAQAAVPQTERPSVATAPTAARPAATPRQPVHETAPTRRSTTRRGGTGTPSAAPSPPPPPPTEPTWSPPPAGPSWSAPQSGAATRTASQLPPAPPAEPKRRGKLAAILSGISLAVAGGGGWIAVNSSGGDGGPSIPLVQEERHPSAPFGRGAAPFKQSGVGVVSVSPFGYEWLEDGSLILEMWVYNAERFSATLDCEVAVSTPEQVVAQSTFPSIEGRVPPGVERPVLLTFPPSDVTAKFADLSVSSIQTRCNWSSR